FVLSFDMRLVNAFNEIQRLGISSGAAVSHKVGAFTERASGAVRKVIQTWTQVFLARSRLQSL
ncbi:hypothetical protein BLX87_05895, partial [Bacillus sp. VT-16-64]